MTARLLELVNSEGKPLYEFEDLEAIRGRNELNCYGYIERDLEDWRNVALKELHNFRFNTKFYILNQRLNIKQLLEEKKSFEENIGELSFLKYHNPFRREYWKNNSKHSLIVDALSLGLGAYLGAMASPVMGGGAFAIIGLFGELLRRGKIKDENLRLKEIQKGIKNYNDMGGFFEKTKIIPFTSEEAKSAIKDIEKLPRFTMIDDEGLNEYLKEVYQTA